MKMKSVCLITLVYFVLVALTAYAAESDYTMDLQVLKKSTSTNEPICVKWIVTNNTDDVLDTYPQVGSTYSHPAIDYRLWIKSVSDDSFDEYTVGPFQSNTGHSVIAPNTSVAIGAYDITQMLCLTPDDLAPGIYRVSIDGNWQGVNPVRFWVEDYFVVEEANSVSQALSDINSNIVYAQDKIEQNKIGIQKNYGFLHKIYTIVRFWWRYRK